MRKIAAFLVVALCCATAWAANVYIYNDNYRESVYLACETMTVDNLGTNPAGGAISTAIGTVADGSVEYIKFVDTTRTDECSDLNSCISLATTGCNLAGSTIQSLSGGGSVCRWACEPVDGIQVKGLIRGCQ